MRLVGHKGADLIAPGNTLESFRAAVEAGVDTIEFDVLWLEDAHLPLEERHATGRRPRLGGRRIADAAEADRGARRLPRAAARPGRDRPRHQAAGAGGGVRRGAARARPDRPGDDLDDGAAHAETRARTGTEPAPRLDLPEDASRLEPAPLGETGAEGGAARDADAAARAGGGEAAPVRRLRDVGLPPAGQPAAGRDLQARRGRADRLDRRRREAHAPSSSTWASTAWSPTTPACTRLDL